MEEHAASQLFRRLEAAKTRNEGLQAMLEAVQTNLSNMRRSAKETKEIQSSTHNYSLSNRRKELKRTELDNEKLIQRLNEAFAYNNKLKEAVNGARNERIIHSGIFKNLEKEIRQYQTTFKELLIERRVDQRNSEKIEAHYSRQKIALLHRVEVARSSTSRQAPSSHNSSRDAIQSYSFRKQTQKPRTAFLKKKVEDRRQVDRNAETLREQQSKYEQIISSLKSFGLKNLVDIDVQAAQVNYESEQIYDGNCQLNNEIHCLEKQLSQKLRGMHSRKSNSHSQHNLPAKNFDQLNNLKDIVAAELKSIAELQRRLQQIGKQLGVESSDEDQLCWEIEEKLSDRLPTNAANLLTAEPEQDYHLEHRILSPDVQAKENRLNLMLSKSKQVRQYDQILSTTQFKQVFREIQNKPTVHLRE